MEMQPTSSPVTAATGEPTRTRWVRDRCHGDGAEATIIKLKACVSNVVSDVKRFTFEQTVQQSVSGCRWDSTVGTTGNSRLGLRNNLKKGVVQNRR